VQSSRAVLAQERLSHFRKCMALWCRKLEHYTVHMVHDSHTTGWFQEPNNGHLLRLLTEDKSARVKKKGRVMCRTLAFSSNRRCCHSKYSWPPLRAKVEFLQTQERDNALANSTCQTTKRYCSPKQTLKKAAWKASQKIASKSQYLHYSCIWVVSTGTMAFIKY
jgi:hypothetical protein